MNGGTVSGPFGELRLSPQLPVHVMKTYGIVAPLSTHFRDAVCAEVSCQAYANGWKTIIDVSDAIGRQRANYIRLHSGRQFTVTEQGTLVTFTFHSGQHCFKQHKVRLEREENFVVRGGDWRGNPRQEGFQHKNAADWVDDFANHQDRIATAHERG
jgi:hypothetical protein